MRKKIPTNIITGFLGVGKTTAILDLLANKPEDQTWAVLVNEFGEIGIDGALLGSSGALVREVPGGCMCCVAGLPMMIGLNTLLAKKPDRLLIEPTGLGHPAQIIATLTGEVYDQQLDLRAMVTLVDPRNLDDSRYTENENFRDQAALADVLVANKVDLCSDREHSHFMAWAQAMVPPKSQLGWIANGKLDPNWLDLAHCARTGGHHHHHADNLIPPETLALAPGERLVRRENRGQGHYSCGWLIRDSERFSFDLLFGLFSGLSVSRLKGVLNTDKGRFGFNATDGVLSVHQYENDEGDSRLEIIHQEPLPWDLIEQALTQAILA